jgi:hypothetical protein
MEFNTNILVYQMGKVGSVSFQVALKEKDLTAIHAHWMKEDGEYPTSKPYLVEQIKKGVRDDWKVITPIREPVARNVSAFFQSIEKYYPAYKEYKYKEAVLESFLNNYNHKWPDMWFEQELMDVFEFDPFLVPFNHKKGYNIYEVKHGKILIIRLEDAERVIAKSVGRLVKKYGMKMARSNMLRVRHNGTRVGKIYQEFMENAQLPEDFLDEVYSMKYAQHFYSKDEIKKFKEKWRGRNR